MYKLDHPLDLTEYQAVQRRRRLDEERMKRIFDPKVRVMGIDVQGLEEQIRVKNELKSIEQERNDVSDRVATETNDLLQMLDAKVCASRRALHRDMDAFRRDHQQPCMRRDFDLYDPALLKNDHPARIGDVDPRNTVSGMQRFEGEDLEQDRRILSQKDQMQVWSWQKMCENEAERKRKEEEDERREQETMANNRRIQYLAEMDRRHRRQIAMDDAEFNRKLAKEKKLRDSEHARMETAKNLEEIQMHVTGDFLTERPAPPQPGPHKIRIDAFKGMSPEQIQEIRDTRERQIKEAHERQEQQRRDNKAWDKHQFWVSRATVLMEREKNRQERDKERQMLAQNQAMASDFKDRKKFIDTIVYTNPPTEAYFGQFNTTSRTAKKPRTKKPAPSSSSSETSAADSRLLSRGKGAVSEASIEARGAQYALNLFAEQARKVREACADSDVDGDTVIEPSQEFRDMASLLVSAHPEIYDVMRDMGLPLPDSLPDWATPAQHRAPGAPCGFPAGFSDLHLEKAVAAIGGEQYLHTLKASVSIAISEIEVSPSSEISALSEEGASSDDEEASGLATRAVVFSMWCHGTRLAHPLCFYTYHSVRPRLVAGHINKVVGKLQSKGFTVISWSSDCTSTYHKVNELVSTNPPIAWIPDPACVIKGLRDALANEELMLVTPSGGIASTLCITELLPVIQRDPRLAKLYTITRESIQLRSDPRVSLPLTLTDITVETGEKLRLMFAEPIEELIGYGSLSASTRMHQASMKGIHATMLYIGLVYKYREAFRSRARIANLNHTVLDELEDVVKYAVVWNRLNDACADRTVDSPAAHARGAAAARAEFKAKSFIPPNTYTALLESVDGFKAAARRLVQTDVKPVVPVVLGNSLLNGFLALVRRTARGQRVEDKHISDEALKIQQQNAMLLRESINMDRTIDYYDGPHNDAGVWKSSDELMVGTEDGHEDVDALIDDLDFDLD
ncbi:hypothetical protein H9P43_002456 [Blastocladiella emersonii ATCC 22665]|nr:hypothetical protein H9P43_002456 [Blastocladiella emersonii ATCC 22665]